jgi:hypothetical protein
MAASKATEPLFRSQPATYNVSVSQWIFTEAERRFMETAAAILTKLAFEQNDGLKSQLQAFGVATPQGAEAVILPVYREILAALERGVTGNTENSAQQNR